MSKRENAAEPKWNEKRQRWEYQVQKDGKRKAFTSTKKGRAGSNEVKRKYNRWLQDDRVSSDPRLRDVWPTYLKDIIARKGEESKTYLDAESAGRTRFLPAYGARKISRITEQDWQELLNDATPLHGSGNLSRKTVMNIRGQITLFCKYLKKSGYIDWKPDTLEIPDKFEYKNDKQILDYNEIKLFMNTKSDSPYVMAFQLMLNYGLRPGEVYGLKWSDVQDSKITIQRSVNNRGEITPGKNKNAQRVEYKTEYARKLLDRAKLIQVRNGKMSEWVFPNQNGNPIYGANANHALKDFCAEINVTPISPYRLRHTFASIAKNALTEAQLKLTLGHSESMDTGIYIHELEQDHIDTGEAINQLFSKILN